MRKTKCRYSEDYEKCQREKGGICDSVYYQRCCIYINLVQKDRKELAEKRAKERLEKELKECQEFDRLSRERYLDNPNSISNVWL